jgi:alpha-beta hydrolase superfamily lysophospholipase
MNGSNATERKGEWIAADGTPLVYAVRSPESSGPLAKLLIVHGMSEYKGRYRLLQEDLARAGFLSYAFDQRGFGESGGVRTYVHSYHQYLDDLALAVESVRKEGPSLPLFLIGHSLGGLISLSYCLRDQLSLSGLVVSSPVVLHAPPPLRVLLLAYLLSYVQPRRSVVYGNQIRYFTHDPKVIEEFLSDPLNQNAGTPRFYIEFQKMRRHLLRNAGRITLPLLILQGTADKIVFPRGAQFLYDHVGSGERRLIWYEGFFHEPFNEIGRERVVEDVVRWIEERLQKNPK